MLNPSGFRLPRRAAPVRGNARVQVTRPVFMGHGGAREEFPAL